MTRHSRQQKYAQRAKSRERQPSGKMSNTYPDRGGHEPGFTGAGDGLDKYRLQKLSAIPQRIPDKEGCTIVRVYVEGYEDVSFWRGIFDDYECDQVTFEISVPPRQDLAKGKKVLLNLVPGSGPLSIICVDSDFDYIFAEATLQSVLVNDSPYLFHTYAYSTENFLCYAPSLHNVCVKATKNDVRIFDFESFLTSYSQTIFPLFLWYAFSASLDKENIFTLVEFKSSVKLNYLEVEENGAGTLKWLGRQVAKRVKSLEGKYPEYVQKLGDFRDRLSRRDVTPQNCYMYMQGHTLMDNVVMVMLNAVCEQLKIMSNIRISSSTKTGTALKNELSNYNNALRNVRDILLDNEGYKSSPLYARLGEDIRRYVEKLKSGK